MSETTAPAALLRQIEALEGARERLAESMDGVEADRQVSRALRDITTADVRHMCCAAFRKT